MICRPHVSRISLQHLWSQHDHAFAPSLQANVQGNLLATLFLKHLQLEITRLNLYVRSCHFWASAIMSSKLSNHTELNPNDFDVNLGQEYNGTILGNSCCTVQVSVTDKSWKKSAFGVTLGCHQTTISGFILLVTAHITCKQREWYYQITSQTYCWSVPYLSVVGKELWGMQRFRLSGVI